MSNKKNIFIHTHKYHLLLTNVKPRGWVSRFKERDNVEKMIIFRGFPYPNDICFVCIEKRVER